MAFNVIIVGAGIAGLSAAIALRNKGHAITLLEATAELQPIGGVMVLQANANRVLDSIGVYDSLLPMCTAVPCGPSTRRYKDGKLLIQKPVEAHKERYGYP
jgi:salicylate hydroxylase